LNLALDGIEDVSLSKSWRNTSDARAVYRRALDVRRRSDVQLDEEHWSDDMLIFQVKSLRDRFASQ
jgi:hypothetical protein